MGERRGTKGLELWCRRMTEGYPGVEVNNMTTSWRDGLAFCAIIHHFRPDLIDFAKLNKNDIYYNNDLAFQVAERHLGIPALLEPEDMVEFPVPDRLSILTYLSQFYQTFVVAQGSPSRIVSKRPANAPDRGVVSPTSASPTPKMPRPSGGVREPCAKCGLPVFIAERLNVDKQLYHRTCFRCARCNSQLTLANYYETETSNQFCCETCPDEEQAKDLDPDASSLSEKIALSRSLSDEEKSAGLQKFDEQDDYSANFETALEDPEDHSLSKNYTLGGEQSVQFMQARSLFITSQLEKSNSESSEDEVVPDLPASDPPHLPTSDPPDLPKSDLLDLPKSDDPPGLPKSRPPDLSGLDEGVHSEITDKPKDSKSFSSIVSDSAQCDSGYPSNVQSLELVVQSSGKFSDVSDRNQPETADPQLDVKEIVTKENKFSDGKRERTSLVKSRMLLFETKADDENSSSTKSPEKKFIHKVPVEEKISSTGFQSVETEVDYGIEGSSHGSSIEVKHEQSENLSKDVKNEAQENKLSEILDSSIITISSGSNAIDKSSNSVSYVSNDESAIIISDSTTNSSNDNKKQQDAIIEALDLAEENPQVEEYPEDLNPFGDDEEEQKVEEEKPKQQASLNPFDDEEEEEEKPASPKPAIRKKIKVRPSNVAVNNALENTLDHLGQIVVQRESINPFEDSKGKKSETKLQPYPNTMKVIPAPRISLNPFWSDGEEPDDAEDDKLRPVPLPRNSRGSIDTPEPKPRKSGLSLSSGLTSSHFGSNTSLSSAHSSLGPTARRKKQAPQPPSKVEKLDSGQSSVASSPSPSVQHSPRLTPRVRKTKKAPLPPCSTPFLSTKDVDSLASTISPINFHEGGDDKFSTKPSAVDPGEWEQEKIIKDELNRNRQSKDISSPISSTENSASLAVPNKSMYGKWKRRKGPAPSLPIPQRRNIKPLPVGETKRELEFIEIQQQGLEKQGVRLEQIIREKCEGPNVDLDSAIAPEVEDLILQLFELVNEKNELFRKQAELMYLRREQRLEEEYADLEYQINCLMLQPEANKTDTDKAREEELIARLVEVVGRRNEIVVSLEMDRVRENEEDDSINRQMHLYASRREEESSTKPSSVEVKQKKKTKKKLKFKHSKKVDVDKDIDESESSSTSVQTKDKKKKKFNIF